MANAWTRRILQLLHELDERESPHGLYGIRAAHAEGARLPSLAFVLASSKAKVIREVSPWCHARHYSDEVIFEADLRSVTMTVRDHASTKVRRFGSTYRLDTHDGKSPHDRELRLDRAVPHLKKGTSSSNALLLVAHAESDQKVHELVGSVEEPAFLERYATELASEIWEDRYGRGFCTGAYLWLNEREDASS